MTKSIEEQAEKYAYTEVSSKQNHNFHHAEQVYINGAKSRDAEIEQLKAQVNAFERNDTHLRNEISALKSRLLDFEGRTCSENQEIVALKSKLKIAKTALEYVAAEGYRSHTRSLSERQQDQMTAKQALSEIGGEI